MKVGVQLLQRERHGYGPSRVPLEAEKTRPPVVKFRSRKLSSRNDFRHRRLTQLAGTGNLTGAGHLAGHPRVSTTALYVNSGRLDAELALAAAAPTGFASSSPSPTNAPARLVGQGNPPNQKALCEGEDSNLHGSYPASTSS